MDIVSSLLEELSAFAGREEALRKEFRWKNRTPMFYRPHLHTHGKHVAWLVQDVVPTIKARGESFDEKLAYALSLVHDDPEIVTGDYAAGDKARMSKDQLQAIADEEMNAIDELAARYPKTIGGFSYRDLLVDMVQLTTKEAQVAKLMDRFDGWGEGLHEIYAGNKAFVGPIVNEYGVTPRFGELNIQLREGMFAKLPYLQSLRDSHVLMQIDALPDMEALCSVGTPHTRDSLEQEAGYPQYDAWLKVMLASSDAEEIENLHTKRE